MTTETTTLSPEMVAIQGRRQGPWGLVREALAGTRHDFTTLPVRRAILLLAIPMVAEMLMESLFALSDIFWVSKLGAAATATVVLIVAARANSVALGSRIPKIRRKYVPDSETR